MTSLSVALHRDVAERLGLDMAGGADDGPVLVRCCAGVSPCVSCRHRVDGRYPVRPNRSGAADAGTVQAPQQAGLHRPAPVSDLNLGLTVTESNTVDPNPETTAGRLTEEPLPAKDTDGAADHRTGEKQAQENQETESPV